MPTYCVPQISGVPGFPASDFDWWTVPVDPNSLRFSPENPNWIGSFSLSEGVGANRHLHFRALRGTVGGQPHLFLSWVMRVSDNQLAIDRLNLVLGSGANYVALQVRLNTGASTVAGTQNAGTFTYRLHSCAVSGGGVITTTGVATTDAADLETSGRMWVDATSPQRQLLTRWGFQVAIPLGVAWGPTALNIPASGAFKLWYEAWASVGMNAVPYHVFTAPAAVETTSVFEIVPAGANPLNTSHMLDMSTGGVGCTTGVELNWGSIGVRSVDGSPRPPGQIQLDLGKAYPPNNAPYNESHTPDVALPQHQNQFFAVPANIAGLSVAQQEALRARFSLANWGSQYSIGTASSWRPVPGGEDVPYTTGNAEARFVWPTVADSYTTTLVRNINKFLNSVGLGTPMPADAQNPHQCMLVELSSTDPTVVITRSSVYTNMNVAGASTFRRLAEISVVGLDPIATPARDVYLYLQTFNMPKVVKDGDGRPGFGNQAFLNDSHATFSAVGSQERPREVEEIAAFYPTYIVHAYHDTGRTLKLEDGSRVPILEPQTSFGYFMQHDGDLYGWETRIYDAEKLSETLYRLAVPHKGSRYVETAIQARESLNEKPLPPDGDVRESGSGSGGVTRCEGLARRLEKHGGLGKLLAMLVRIICRLLGG